MSETQEAPAKAKRETVYTPVTMLDGRVVQFPGEQKVKKSVIFEDGRAVGVQFDFRNGEFRQFAMNELDEPTAAYATCHGLLQKIGDEWSGTKDPEDMVLTCDEIMARLRNSEWAVERQAGDSMAGASIVIKAIMEASGKSVADVKAFLDSKLKTAKDRGEKLTRQALYQSFRNPTSAVGKIIRRMEEEKAAKSSAVDADATLAELTSA